MRIGVFGTGRIGVRHAGIFDRMPEVEALLLTDADPARAAAAAGQLSKASATEAAAVWESADAVVIASSTDTHAALLIEAARHGLPAFCEKPVSLDLESTRAALDAVEGAGVTVQMGFQRRYDPGMRAIRDRIAGGELGVPYLVRSQTHDPEPPPLDYLPHSGGIFRDCMIHDIDAVRYVTGQEVVEVLASGAVIGFPEIGELNDVGTATAIFKMSAGTLAQLSALRHDPVGYDVRLEVFAPKDSLAAGWSARTPIHSTEPGVGRTDDPIISFWDRFDAAYALEMEAFIRVLRGEEEPASTPVDAYEDLRVAVACDLSLAEGRPVKLEEIK